MKWIAQKKELLQQEQLEQQQAEQALAASQPATKYVATLWPMEVFSLTPLCFRRRPSLLKRVVGKGGSK
jgi:hypothetical protein